MFRMVPISDAGKAAEYFGQADGGYHLDGTELRREWGGKDAARLGLTGAPTFEQFTRLLHGLDPHTGKQLTALLVEDRVPGWEFLACVPKGVTTALERGDTRIRDALWEAGNEAMADVQQYATTRVRKGGRDEDRVTGSFVYLGVEHPDTRPTKEDGMPDWDRHLHFIVANATWDAVEQEWKALKVRQIFDMKKWFDRRFDLRMAAKLVDLGYEIETKQKADERGGRRYYSWDIKGIPDSVIDKFSRRTREVEDAEKQAVAAIKEKEKAKGNADWNKLPDRLSTVARDKLGGSSRQAKRKDLTLADYRDYWHGRITPEEGGQIGETIKRALLGKNPKPERQAEAAMAWAVAHHFQRASVVDYRDLAITAMERGMGTARPEDFEPQAWRRHGVLFQGDDCSTRDVLAQEQRIIGFARAGRGVFAPLAAGKEDGLSGLSAEQQAAVRHVWDSTDQVMLIRGGAGTGKTTMMTPALSHLGAPVVLLAPSSDASRGQLRKEGFSDANTVAAFLDRKEMQEKVKDGGIIWVDEAGLLAINDLERLCDVAASLDARLVLQGDPRQHKAVDRHGNMLSVLEEFAGLPVARLTTIQRQKGDYAQAVAAIRDGKLEEADTILRGLGWVVEGNGHDQLVAEYARAIEEKKLDGTAKSVLVIDPTHKDGDALTERLREVRKEKGLIVGAEKTFRRLVPLGWTDAQKADASQYAGNETVQFFRNSGRFKAGARVAVSELLPHLAKLKPEHFAVYREDQVSLAVGDTVRITANGRDVTGKHRVDNGRIDTIKAFTPGGDLVLSNGWVIGQDFGHLKHGLVQTSPATQSKTEDIVLAAMNRASLGAMSAEQGYVTLSRGRERGMVFTDLPREEWLKALRRADSRRSATELFQPKAQADETATAEERMHEFMQKVRMTYRQLTQRAAAMVKQPLKEREMGYAR